MDLNGDGNRDLLAAGYAGICYIFYGKKNGQLRNYRILKDKKGKKIHTGTYYDFDKGDYVFVKGVENSYKLDFVKAVDWDNDGDLDLLLSGRGGVKLCVNNGSKTKPVFDTQRTTVLPKHYADAVEDWDGDGLWDIVCGSKKGGVYFYKNNGRLGSPKFEKPICLISRDELLDKEKGGKIEISQVAVADYNNDGKLDLVIGNNNYINKYKIDLTDSQIKEKEELEERCEILLNKMMVFLNRRIRGLEQKKIKGESEEEIRKQYGESHKRLKKYCPPSTPHGYVFVSLRK